MDYQNLFIQIQAGTACIRIQREAQLNALNHQTITELKHALTAFKEDKAVFGLIITGSGDKAFIAGADIKEFQDKNIQQATELARFGHELMDMLSTYPKPVIAAINGFALGGGLELALACHMRIASTTAKMGLVEVSLGLIPGYGGTQRLRALVGKGKAMEMILTGDMIDAQDAYHWGLVNQVVPPQDLLQAAQKILDKTYTRSKNAMAQSIAAICAGENKDTDGFQFEIEAFGQCFQSDDFKEGLQAFIEKRKPNFRS